jgi:hypothetical protein
MILVCICILAKIRARIEAELSRSNTNILTDDLNVVLYSAKSDQDIDFVVNAVQKYMIQKSEDGAVNVNFEGRFMRLLYDLNKTDKALELFMAEVILHFSVF